MAWRLSSTAPASGTLLPRSRPANTPPPPPAAVPAKLPPPPPAAAAPDGASSALTKVAPLAPALRGESPATLPTARTYVLPPPTLVPDSRARGLDTRDRGGVVAPAPPAFLPPPPPPPALPTDSRSSVPDARGVSGGAFSAPPLPSIDAAVLSMPWRLMPPAAAASARAAASAAAAARAASVEGLGHTSSRAPAGPAVRVTSAGTLGTEAGGAGGVGGGRGCRQG
jgi:hypothetical protein